MQKRILVIFPLANDVSGNLIWTDIGPNAKRRIDDVVRATRDGGVDTKKIAVFAIGTDRSHALGSTLAELGAAYFNVEHGHNHFSLVVNKDDKLVFSTDTEIHWGVTKILQMHSLEDFDVRFVFATQRRHMPRVRWIVRKRFPYIDAEFVVTGQTKEIPLWREGVSWIKLWLGNGRIGQAVQTIRRAMPDHFSKA